MKWRAVGLVGVVLAAVLLLAYGNHDGRARVGGLPDDVGSVLLAKQRIPKGTPYWIVETNGMYQTTRLRAKEVEDGAIADPAYLSGRAAAADIFPGQQLTETNFTACPTSCRP